ncbi:MAG: SDR family NAD(P)-dependent oxidoreductase, partial [Lachnospiraceae bacterium]|nr:SDR family NAD(P)-dependent oxidoreductase [Lachnospiraceae bacterium]
MLVNSAGYGLMGAVEDLDLEEQLGMLTTNCEALTRLTCLCLPYMRRNSRIINMASSAGFIPRAGFAVYAATKAYVLRFSRALNEELRYRSIYVTAVCPGPVDTEFFETADQYGTDLGINRRSMAQPEPVVEKALRDSYLKKDMSVYSLPVKAFHVLTRLVPHRAIMAVTRYID